jgi:hypothetical protein
MTDGLEKGKMWNALWRMMNKQSRNQARDYTFSANDYEEARIQHAKAQSLFMSGSNNPFFGKKHSDKTKKIMSVAKKGKSYEEIFGIEAAIEMRKRRGIEQQGRIKGPQTKLTCPHCNKSGGAGIMKRWHLNRCKLKNLETV